MYYCFKKGILPSVFQGLGTNEKRILQAFMFKEFEEIEEQNKALGGGEN